MARGSSSVVSSRTGTGMNGSLAGGGGLTSGSAQGGNERSIHGTQERTSVGTSGTETGRNHGRNSRGTRPFQLRHVREKGHKNHSATCDSAACTVSGMVCEHNDTEDADTCDPAADTPSACCCVSREMRLD